MKNTSTRVHLVIAKFLLVTLCLAGCGGSMMRIEPNPTPKHAGAKFLYVVNSIEASVRGFSISGASGELTPVGPSAPADEAPIYAASTPDGKYLYVANAGTNAIGVSAYRINSFTGALTPTSPAEFPTTGDSQPLGIAVDRTSTHVYTANAQTISAFTIDSSTGALTDVPGTPVAVPETIQFVVIALTPDSRFLYATDILNNRVWEFAVTSSGLPKLVTASVATGKYPSGIAVDPSGKFAYVTNWMSNDISRFAITPGTGVLVSTGATTPMEAGCGPQELAVDPSVRNLFVSCAGVSKIARFAIDSASGGLSALSSFSPGPFTAPRGIAIDSSGSYLYSAWNMQNKTGSAAIDPSGSLTALPGEPSTGRGPIGVALSGQQ